MGNLIKLKKQMKFAIAALLGIAALTTETANAMIVMSKPSYKANLQMESDSESDSESDDENVQLKGDYYTVADDGKAMNGAYERVTTPRFAADSDDIFMRSMIQQYALEAKNCDEDGANCVPSGNFWMSESAPRAAAAEVLNTHKGLSGEALSSYLDTYFAKAWGHFDVNRVGYIEVIKSPQVMRFLCSDQYMSLGESG